MGDEYEGTADVADMNQGAFGGDDEDIDEDLDFGNPGAAANKPDQEEQLQQ